MTEEHEEHEEHEQDVKKSLEFDKEKFFKELKKYRESSTKIETKGEVLGTVTVHALMTLVTGGTWIILYWVYFLYKFSNKSGEEFFEEVKYTKVEEE